MAKRFSNFAASQEAALSKVGSRPAATPHNVQIITALIAAATVANADEAVIAILPKGAQIVPSQCRVTGNGGSAIAGTLGYEPLEGGSPQDDGFGIAVQTRQDEGGGLSLSDSETNDPLESQSYVYVKASAAGTAGTGTGNVKFTLAYTLLT